MKYILEIEYKPFRGKQKKYSGLYTPVKRRTKRGRIEIDSNDPPLEQVDSLGHEFAHFLWDVTFKGTYSLELHEAFAVEMGKATRRIVKKHMKGA